MCDKTCIFFFFPIINKYFLMAKRSLLSRCPSRFETPVTTRPTARRHIPGRLHSSTARLSERPRLHTVLNGTCATKCLIPSVRHCLIFCHRKGQSHVHMRMRVPSSDVQQSNHQTSFLCTITLTFWRRNYFFNFSTLCILNVNNTGTKQVRIMKQTAF